jgi:hypothetical protein
MKTQYRIHVSDLIMIKCICKQKYIHVFLTKNYGKIVINKN